MTNPRPGPGRIHKLDESVVNRIAAGEIIVRPANAVKEMLENSLDAGATEISVVVKNGGLGMVQIHDNGCGIKKEDFSIVCERFTTSKIEKFDDITRLTSFGFRGEALASISFIGKVRIISRTADAVCAYQMEYNMGLPMAAAKALAGNVGTMITVEDFFYNNPTRRAVLSSAADEYGKIMEVLTKYAMRYPHVGFSLRKFDQHAADLRTPAKSTTLDNAKILFKDTISRELLPVEDTNDKFQYKLTGYVSNPNFSTKKYIFLFFINGRAVECGELRKCMELLYAPILPKQGFPFVYLSLDLPPILVDVNVHPTKAEVHFRFEKEIIASLYTAVQQCLLTCDQSRTYSVIIPPARTLSTGSNSNELPYLSQASTILPDRITPARAVRTDSRLQTLDAFIRPSSALDIDVDEELRSMETAASEVVSSVLATKERAREFNYTSLLELRATVEGSMDVELRKVFAEHKFVGCASENTVLIQHGTKMFAVNIRRLSEELFYQLVLFDFGNFGVFKLEKPFPLRKLLYLAMDEHSATPVSDLAEREHIADKATEFLKGKGKMLADYFSLQFSTQGNLLTLPILLTNYVPPLSELPLFIGRLATEVRWTSEKECFEDIAREIASFHAFCRDFYAENDNTAASWKWTAEHIIMPAVRSMLLPPKSMWTDRIIVEVADLPKLYRVFERC
ncbi:DNA mismatch repair protein Mlh1-like [Paramacrobiotus metropolitanus]|uniref:DNA mismatch repair protein Mlh1-like n=1 Tax=Paramacrobiotus metropolitanus TaxID=2943436 RepID=UPI0024465CB4|nr:DNA mismatch repair protein Mlh1-like [Paramacrobiotus metropolitanus]